MTNSSGPSVLPELSHLHVCPSITLQQLSPPLVHAVLMLGVASDALLVLAPEDCRVWSLNREREWVR